MWQAIKGRALQVGRWAKKSKQNSVVAWCGGLGLGFVAIWLLLIGNFYFVQFVPWAIKPDIGTQGQFGDSLNAATSLFSGLAIIGVILTVWLQIYEREDAEKAHTAQLEIAKQTAQLQTLTYLADMSNRMMQDTEDTQQIIAYQGLTNQFVTHSFRILGSLGLHMAGEPLYVQSSLEMAFRELENVCGFTRQFYERHGVPITDMDAIQGTLDSHRDRLRRWLNTNTHRVDGLFVNAINLALTHYTALEECLAHNDVAQASDRCNELCEACTVLVAMSREFRKAFGFMREDEST